MAEQINSIDISYQPRIAPERLAWGVLLISFAFFCVISLSIILSIYFFLFESTIPAKTILRVGRGTVGITDSDLIPRAILQQDELSNRPTIVSTDAQSQATISFYEPGNLEGTDDLIATITLKSDSSIEFRQASIPRFEWSTVQRSIDLRGFQGEVDVLITGATIRNLALRIQTSQGYLVQLIQNGRYSVRVTETHVTVINREGEAILFNTDFRNNRFVPSDQQGTIAVNSHDIVLTPANKNLVENGLFSLLDTPADDNEILLPVRWGCRDNQDDLPRGTFAVETFDGRSVLRLHRSENAQSHGETGCLQPFIENQQDIQEYDSLHLVTTFYINYQSLSKCGVAGSECPLMMLMEYIDINGIARRWYRGFYYADNIALDYPPRCSSCSQDHEQINEKAWYTFETDNLLNFFPPDRRPARLKNIEIYASGHQYDVLLSEISIFAGTSTIPTSPDNTVPDT